MKLYHSLCRWYVPSHWQHCLSKPGPSITNISWDVEPDFNSTEHEVSTETNADDTCHLFRVLYILAAINVYYTPVVVILGSVTNILASVTLCVSKLKKNPISHYLAAKSLSDSVFLLCLVLLWAAHMGIPSIRTDALCPYLYLGSRMSSFISVWLVVLMCLERNILVCENWWPFCGKYCQTRGKFGTRYKTYCSILKSQILIIALVILGTCVYVNISVTISAFKYGNTSICWSVFPNTFRMLDKFDIVFNVVIPYFLVILLSACTWRAVMHVTAIRKGTIAQRGLEQGTVRFCPKAEIHSTKVVCIYCVVFLLMTLPTQSLRIFHETRDTFNIHVNLGIRGYLWQHCTQVLFQSSYAINFIVLLASHHTFRKALRQLILSWFFRLKTAIHNIRKPRDQYLGIQAFQFTVEFSSTLVRLKETNLG